MSALKNYGLSKAEIVEWYENLTKEEQNYSRIQITNAYVMGLPIEEAPADYPEDNPDDADFIDLWDEICNILYEVA